MVKNIISKEYEKDFYAWAIYNAKLLREGKFSNVDIEHVAEEIESMGKSEKRELVNRLAVLMAHLLKWKYQPEKRTKSWTLTIKNQRIQLSDLLEESPSLKKELEEKFHHAYERAKVLAAKQTRLEEDEFPKHPPFSFKDCLKSSFLPD
ncbi:MAG: DUF29 domain-containing protein [Gammaproteobacteria bacterium]|nr:MAG: DUF29 domain-containing protein [Gammaproteobacteria bacterium]